MEMKDLKSVTACNKALKALKIEYAEKRDALETVGNLMFAIKKFKKTLCKHTRIKKTSSSYFEEGRMRAPVDYNIYTCKACGTDVGKEDYEASIGMEVCSSCSREGSLRKIGVTKGKNLIMECVFCKRVEIR